MHHHRPQAVRHHGILNLAGPFLLKGGIDLVQQMAPNVAPVLTHPAVNQNVEQIITQKLLVGGLIKEVRQLIKSHQPQSFLQIFVLFEQGLDELTQQIVIGQTDEHGVVHGFLQLARLEARLRVIRETASYFFDFLYLALPPFLSGLITVIAYPVRQEQHSLHDEPPGLSRTP